MPTAFAPADASPRRRRGRRSTPADDHARRARAAPRCTLDVRRRRAQPSAVGPHLAEPPHRPADVVVPQRIVARHDHVEPHASRPAPSAPRLRRCAGARRRRRPRGTRPRRRRLVALRRPEHERRRGRRRATTPAGSPAGSQRVERRRAPRGCSIRQGRAGRDRATVAASARLGEVRLPRLGHTAHRDGDPRQLARRVRRPGERHPGLVGRAVALGQVARPARRGDVLPRVLAAARPRHDVVDRVGEARRSTGSGGRRGRTRPAATARCGGGTAPSRRSAAG